MKGQTTLEFVGSALFFLLAVIGVLTLVSAEIPVFYDNVDTTEKNLEAKYMTDYLLSSDTSSNPGLVTEYMKLDKDFIENDLGTAADSGDLEYNYTEMVSDLGLEYQHNIQITWYPVVETHRNFIRGSPPTIDGETLEEPNTVEYSNDANRVHYGDIDLEGTNQKFLITARDGEYSNLYHNDEWDFRTTRYGEGDEIILDGREFTVESIQNRPDRPGASVVLSSEVVFGDDRPYLGNSEDSTEGEVVKLTRYPMMDDPNGGLEPAKMEVLVW